MKFRLPKEIKIGGKRYPVKTENLASKDLDGFISYRESLISIDIKCDQVHALLHEITHGVARYLGINDLGEEWTERIAHAQRMMISDNPALFRRLADHLGGGR
jgi:hypothetical protein